ncbi:MAG TPA: threonine--tRNA ligase [Candidatus Nanoarchaeia archaeon]|nr:threonine--tRNA ligase [Candidatus Nanoarchaeia archaeon]
MTHIKINFPDGSVKDYIKGITAGEIAMQISPRLAEEAVVAKINNELKDLSYPINEDSTLQILKLKDKEGLDALRHSVAHLLAAAIMEIYPNTKRTIGPAIENGFYFDFEFEKPITEEDLAKIENKMREILPNWDKFERHELSAAEAKKEYPNNQFKHELIDEFSKGNKKISFYKSGNYWDLCRGGHLSSMKKVKPDSFKLTKLAGAYWRGSEKNPMLTRIYGLAFATKKELDEYLKQQAEAEKRDHRKIGKELDLFSFSEITPGSPFFHPKGAFMFIALQSFLRELYPSWGYQEVITPLIYDSELWKKSGHWDHFREHMFEVQMDHKEAALKPMNCPSHILIYKTSTRSYRDLPLRITDFAPLHRNEIKGTLGGLMRVRKFSQDDCHVFCTPEQIKNEVKSHIAHARHVYSDVFGFDFHVELSTRPENSMGAGEMWELAEKSLTEVLDESGLKYTINPGDGAFYGPKIDFHIKDALGRSWQCGTEQLDFQQPQRFKVEYKGADNSDHNAVMLHRTVLGSIERFLGILIEHFAGKFPLWISPVQIRILTVADRFNDYANKLKNEFEKNNLRVEIDSSAESIGKKVFEAQNEKIPLIITVGEKEESANTVAVRTAEGKVHFGLKTDEFLKKVLDNIKEKKIRVDL